MCSTLEYIILIQSNEEITIQSGVDVKVTKAADCENIRRKGDTNKEIYKSQNFCIHSIRQFEFDSLTNVWNKMIKRTNFTERNSYEKGNPKTKEPNLFINSSQQPENSKNTIARYQELGRPTSPQKVHKRRHTKRY